MLFDIYYIQAYQAYKVDVIHILNNFTYKQAL